MNLTKLFIIGCGDIGFRVASLARHRGEAVIGLSRGEKQFPAELVGNTDLVAANLDDPQSLPQLDYRGAGLLYSAPPPGGGICDSRVTNFLASIDPEGSPAKIVYISTTSVYGDCGDAPVDEARPAAPSNHTGRRRLDAEQQFTVWCAAHNVPLVILRVAGIYGPGRIPMQRILNREPLLAAAEAGYSNRIHAGDLAEICLAALDRGAAGEIFNVCDGEWGKLNDYFNAITDLLGLERLPEVPLVEARQVMTPLMFSYMSESRRIDNRKMVEKLGIRLKYPTMKAGLQEILAAEMAKK